MANVSGSNNANKIKVSNTKAEYHSNLTKEYMEKAKEYARECEANYEKSDEQYNAITQILEELPAAKNSMLEEIKNCGDDKIEDIIENLSLYSNTSKDWANKLTDTVDGEEYSSKYYALQSKNIAEEAINNISSAKESVKAEIISSANEAIQSIQKQEDAILTDTLESIENKANQIEIDLDINKEINSKTNIILHDYNKFCVNIGSYDTDGNPDLLQLSNGIISTKVPFVYTQANGITHNVDEILSLDISGFEDGEYTICVDYIEGIYLLCVGNPEMDLSNPPYLAYETINNQKVLTTKVPVGTAVISGGGGNLSTNIYNAPYKKKSINAYSKIGEPIITFCDEIADNEIWYEGAIVSRVTYAELFKLYGEKFGAGDGITTFQLPDTREKTFWGSTGNDDYGYIEAGLPNITGYKRLIGAGQESKGAFIFNNMTSKIATNNGGNYWSEGDFMLNANNSSLIYGKSNTVQPPAIKVRVKARYK